MQLEEIAILIYEKFPIFCYFERFMRYAVSSIISSAMWRLIDSVTRDKNIVQ